LYFLALACDYDGTIAHHGRVDAETVSVLRRFKETGRRLVLVTGRELGDLKQVFPDIDIFDLLVVENGAVVYDPHHEEEHVLSPPPPEEFVHRLTLRGVQPLSVGRSIVATWEPHQTTVLETIQELGLELQIIFNKGAVMILPSGVNKAAGLAAALARLELSFHNVVGVGDAENDHAFLKACGCAAAVFNALPAVRETADIKLARDHGAGVIELIELVERLDSRIVGPERNGISIGVDAQGETAYLEVQHGSVLIAGQSGIGKSTLATALTERMADRGFEFCVFDPEGDYVDLENAIVLGDAKTPPSIDEAQKLIEKTSANLVVNTQGIAVGERPGFFLNLLPHITSLRSRTGRPHWLLVDEAHHLLPSPREDVTQVLPEVLPAAIFITVHPELISVDILRTVGTVIALGEAAADEIDAFCDATGERKPEGSVKPHEDEVLLWHRASGLPPRSVKPERPRQVHKRHIQKYAEGNLGPDRSFYFRGPQNALNLRAQNLMLFLQIADGVDDDTWEYHLRRGDYSRWFREIIGSDELASEVAEIETNPHHGPLESRKLIGEAVRVRYTTPAS
jgi:HAD superfamily hydrolase (TIGR01484 family)